MTLTEYTFEIPVLANDESILRKLLRDAFARRGITLSVSTRTKLQDIVTRNRGGGVPDFP
jgi:hypothetical protein